MTGSTLSEKVLGRHEIIIVFSCNLREQQMENFIRPSQKQSMKVCARDQGKKSTGIGACL